MEKKTTAAKFWVGLVGVIATQLCAFALPSPWDMVASIVAGTATAVAIYLTPNREKV